MFERSNFEGVCSLACVIDAFGITGKLIDNHVESAGVLIPWRSVALWSRFVSVPTPWRDERSEGANFLSDWHSVIDVPSRGDCLRGPWKHRCCLMKWGLGVMCFKDSIKPYAMGFPKKM